MNIKTDTNGCMTANHNQATTAPRLALRQVQPDMYVLDTLLGAEMLAADREFFTLLEQVKALDPDLFDTLESAHNDAMTTITERAFVAGVQVGRNPWPMLLEPVDDVRPAGEG
jgi:hypothetical protein